MQRQEIVEIELHKQELNKDLFIAAQHGKTDEISRLLDAGADVNATFSYTFFCYEIKKSRILQHDREEFKKVSALHCAAYKGHVQTVDLLIQRGADVSLRAIRYFKREGLKQKYEPDVLTIALSANRIEVVQLLLENHHITANLSIEKKVKLFSSLIRAALDVGYIEMASLLIKYSLGEEEGVKEEIKDLLNSRLFSAAEKGRAEEIIQLIKLGADVNATCGWDLLFYNGEKRQTYFEELFNKPANEWKSLGKVTLREYWFEDVTPLHVAAANGHAALVDVLIKQGADVKKLATFESNHPQDVFDLAVVYNRLDIAELLLKKYKVDVNGDCVGDNPNKIRTDKKDEEGETIYRNNYSPPIVVAAVAGYTEMVKLLLNHGANINIVNSTSVMRSYPTIAHVSAVDIEMIKYLVFNKARILLNSSANPIHLAFREYAILLATNEHETRKGLRCKETIHFLLACGAGLFESFSKEEWPCSFPFLPQTLLIGAKIEGVPITHDTPGCKDVILTIDEFQQAILEEKKIDIQIPMILETCRTNIMRMEKWKQNKLLTELKKVEHIIISNLSLTERSCYAVGKYGFFSGHYQKDVLPEQLLEKLNQYQKFYV